MKCKHGHELDTANVYIAPNGKRSCRRCRCAAAQKSHSRPEACVRLRAYFKEWRRRNKQKNHTYVRKYRKQQVEWYRDLREGLVCSRCPEDHPACIDFHHRNPAEKDFDLHKAVCGGWARSRIVDELMKCDILCSNCHRKLHWEERQSVTASINEE